MEEKPDKELRQIFKNRSDCYADTWIDIGGLMKEGEVVQAMTEDRFIEVVLPLQEKIKELDSISNELSDMVGHRDTKIELIEKRASDSNGAAIDYIRKLKQALTDKDSIIKDLQEREVKWKERMRL